MPHDGLGSCSGRRFSAGGAEVGLSPMEPFEVKNLMENLDKEKYFQSISNSVILKVFPHSWF